MSENVPFVGLPSAPLASTPLDDISERYEDCLTSFKTLLQNLSLPATPPTDDDGYLASKALEQYARFRTWGEETRATLPAASRGSLDDTLRKNESMKRTATSLILKIQRQVNNSIHLTGHRNQSHHDAQENILEADIDSDIDTEPSSDEDDIADGTNTSSKMGAQARIFRNLKDDIDSLYQFSLLISRPGFIRQYVHSSNQAFDSRVSHFSAFDILHVEEKVHEWNRLRLPEAEEDKITPGIVEWRAMLEPSPTLHTLVRRLARANTKRREQLLYWSKHPDQVRTTTSILLPPKTTAISATSMGKSRLGRAGGDPAHRQMLEEAKSQAPASIMTKNTFSTVVVSDLLGPQTVAGPARTIYAESTVGNKQSNRVPDLPNSVLKGDVFECPYCRLPLSSQQMQIRAEWKRHVFRDLRPYICTFKDCQNADKQYPTRHDWIYHEMQIHRRQWVCEEHDARFHSREALHDHLTQDHSISVPQQQLSVLMEMSERQCDEMEILPCPLCPDERRLKILHSHVAEHLESVALFVLSGYDEAEEEERDDSNDAADGNASTRIQNTDTSDGSQNHNGSDSSHEHKGKTTQCGDCNLEWKPSNENPTCPRCESTSLTKQEKVPEREIILLDLDSYVFTREGLALFSILTRQAEVVAMVLRFLTERTRILDSNLQIKSNCATLSREAAATATYLHSHGRLIAADMNLDDEFPPTHRDGIDLLNQAFRDSNFLCYIQYDRTVRNLFVTLISINYHLDLEPIEEPWCRPKSGHPPRLNLDESGLHANIVSKMPLFEVLFDYAWLLIQTLDHLVNSTKESDFADMPDALKSPVLPSSSTTPSDEALIDPVGTLV
ncbi:hypothetical protein CC80DRAFT_507591 [Byssothecium circinans]|uniref:C2H2-type domain-containing protein n=1 Tax=Byssothecium circinans TaxID=147558 RepID=A0A6A5TKW9_9PLEO|nr:hypothetical protein CC80DRAFT_507591 [Byssothecium circinans]